MEKWKRKTKRKILTLEDFKVGDMIINWINQIGIVKKIKPNGKHNGYIKIQFMYYNRFDGICYKTIKYYDKHLD